MKHTPRMTLLPQFVFVVSLFKVANAVSSVTISDNGYSDVLVAISSTVKEDESLVQNIKDLMINASSTLYEATHHRAYFRDVKILIPKSWTKINVDNITDDVFQDADVRIGSPNDLFGDAPFMSRIGGCGEPGQFIQFTPRFLAGDMDHFFNQGKEMVRQWAQYRYGIFQEHGCPGDPLYPLFYPGQGLPNYCVNQRLHGNATDIRTNKACNVDKISGLPDSYCRFIPHGENAAVSSMMSMSSIDSMKLFCDKNTHVGEAPNPHSHLCQGKSTWEVITYHQDFARSQNPPRNVLSTKPRFTTLQQKDPRFVLVLDVSDSMVGENRMMIVNKSIKRWLKLDVPHDIQLGIVEFSEHSTILANLTTINTISKQNLLQQVPNKAQSSSERCIGCGLSTALWMLQNDGVIILLAAGEENRKPYMNGVLSSLERAGIRLVTIALGNSADEQLGYMAEETYGRSYFAKNYVGLKQALDHAIIYYSGMTFNKRPIMLIDEEYRGSKTAVVGTFGLDGSVGTDLVLLIDSSRESYVEDLIIVAPNGHSYAKEEAVWDNDVNVFSFTQNFVMSGIWNYVIAVNVNEKDDYIVVSAKTSARSSTDHPLELHCSIISESAYVNPDFSNVKIVAKVTQGDLPVLDAKASAVVTRSESREEPVRFPLWDNGAGADLIRNDGVYARYFTNYGVNGLYSVICEVWNEEEGGAYVNKGFQNTDEPFCFGSEFPVGIPQALEAFNRTALGGVFEVSGNASAYIDFLPPSRVTDLSAKVVNNSVEMSWTAPGDELDRGRAQEYVVKFSNDFRSLTDHFDSSSSNHQIFPSMLSSGSMKPSAAGTSESMLIRGHKAFHLANNALCYFAIRAKDEKNHFSDTSNIAAVMLPKLFFPPTTTVRPNESTTEDYYDEYFNMDGLNEGQALGVSLGVVVGVFLLAGIFAVVIVRKKSVTKFRQRFRATAYYHGGPQDNNLIMPAWKTDYIFSINQSGGFERNDTVV